MESLPRSFKLRRVLEIGEERLPVPDTVWGSKDKMEGEDVAIEAVGGLFAEYRVQNWVRHPSNQVRGCAWRRWLRRKPARVSID